MSVQLAETSLVKSNNLCKNGVLDGLVVRCRSSFGVALGDDGRVVGYYLA